MARVGTWLGVRVRYGGLRCLLQTRVDVIGLRLKRIRSRWCLGFHGDAGILDAVGAKVTVLPDLSSYRKAVRDNTLCDAATGQQLM